MKSKSWKYITNIHEIFICFELIYDIINKFNIQTWFNLFATKDTNTNSSKFLMKISGWLSVEYFIK